MQRYSIKEETLRDIAGAIRSRTGTEQKLSPVNFIDEILKIGGDKMNEYINFDATSFPNMIKKVPETLTMESGGAGLFAHLGSLQEVPQGSFYEKCTTLYNAFYGCGATYMGDLEAPLATNVGYCFSHVNFDTVGNLSFPSATAAEYMFSGNTTKLTSVGNIYLPKITTFSNGFYRSEALQTIGDITCPLVSTATNLFDGCKSLKHVKFVGGFAPTNARSMFNGCNSLESVEGVDFSKATEARHLFYDCNNLKRVGIVNLSKASFPSTDTYSAFARTFYNCSALEEIEGLILPTSIPDCSEMFYNCTSLTHIPDLDVPNVKKTYRMFSGCNNLESIPQMDTSKVTDMSYMFAGCKKVTNFDWLDITSAENISYIFQNCTSLESAPNLDTSNVTNMEGMFAYCSSLKNVPLYNINNITSLTNFFIGCENLEDVPDFDISHITSMTYCFQGCKKLKRIPDWDYSNLTNYGYMFQDSGIEYIDNLELPKGYDYISKTFSGCKDLVEVNNFICNCPYSVSETFAGCTNLIRVNSFSVPNATYVSSTFSGCSKLEYVGNMSIPCSNGSSSFSGCKKLREVGMFKAKGSIESLFANCSSLEKVTIDLTNITDIDYLFESCTNLKEITFVGDPSKITSRQYVTRWGSSSGTVYYDAKYNYTALLGSFGSGWQKVPIMEITECTDLVITGKNVEWDELRVPIQWTATVSGIVEGTGEEKTGVMVTGEGYVELQEQNTYIEDIEKEISFTYMGVTATTTIIHYANLPKSYSVICEQCCFLDPNIPNPDVEQYDGVYRTRREFIDPRTTVKMMTIEITNYRNFEILGEIDVGLNGNISGAVAYIYFKTLDTENSNYASLRYKGYTSVLYENIPLGTHTISIYYYPPSRFNNNGTDGARIIIPKNQ